jgi:hypothetical protein
MKPIHLLIPALGVLIGWSAGELMPTAQAMSQNQWHPEWELSPSEIQVESLDASASEADIAEQVAIAEALWGSDVTITLYRDKWSGEIESAGLYILDSDDDPDFDEDSVPAAYGDLLSPEDDQ